jgi:hypothetical protein
MPSLSVRILPRYVILEAQSLRRDDHRRHGGAPRVEFWVGVLGPRSVWRLHHPVGRGVAIGVGELSSMGPLDRRRRSDLTRSPIDATEVKFAGVIARSGISIAKSASTVKTSLSCRAKSGQRREDCPQRRIHDRQSDRAAGDARYQRSSVPFPRDRSAWMISRRRDTGDDSLSGR